MSKNIILICLYLPLFSGMYYIQQIVGVLEYILFFIFILSVLYFFHTVRSYIQKKSALSLVDYGKKLFINIGIISYICIGFLGSFWYYQIVYNPVSLPQVTVSNGNKTLVFQQMIHIAKQNYYESIQSEIEFYKQNGYVYFFEGVQSGSIENGKRFNEALGITFDSEIYSTIAKLYGLVDQQNQEFLGIFNNKDYNIDTNIDKIMHIYEQKTEKENTKIISHPIDIEKEIGEQLSLLNSKELQLLQHIQLSFLSFLTRNSDLVEGIHNNIGNTILFDIILEGRNQIVADAIIQRKNTKIFATYGALHFDGILSILQKNDPNWKIIHKKDFYPFVEK